MTPARRFFDQRFTESGLTWISAPDGVTTGVDIRIWEKGTDRDPTTLTIVQCKRERRKVGKVVVKALAADVKWNGAVKGLLVATTDWSSAARAIARTRAYPVEEVNEDAVATWYVR
ncbi:restriction endonuclease [Streptomyces sp. NPDC085596]|uniref:restriction endonuclease n=1 Tax=Streptomyces sp. NPDC085596 TaxID=3365731 RepID=UPI0037D1255D